ncbi:MAG: MBL fold metallo-hydrolase [Bacillota bacterium]|nr:MBL fold metallo-hydrolase [Bacillota bacterium]
MEQIIVLDIEAQFRANKNPVHPVILIDEREMILVDTAFIGFLENIEKAFESHNLKCGDLTKVIITHQDHDHMGSLAALKRKYPHIEVIAGETEEPYISGKMKSARLLQAEERQKHLPEEQKTFGEAFINMLRNVEPCRVNTTVKGGDTFGWCGGCEIVDTPGHTPGHISLYLKKHKTVITGDAACVENGKIGVANPIYTLDMERAKEDIEKLLNLPATTYICFHGGIYKK